MRPTYDCIATTWYLLATTTFLDFELIHLPWREANFVTWGGRNSEDISTFFQRDEMEDRQPKSSASPPLLSGLPSLDITTLTPPADTFTDWGRMHIEEEYVSNQTRT